MALLDLSLITRSLVNLIEVGVKASPEWPATRHLSVEPEPPDRLKGANTLGFYLYHLKEEPHGKNRPPQGAGPAAVSYTPMALELFYVLTAYSDRDEQPAYNEQLMMGLAVKTLRDHPIITENATFLDRATGISTRIMDLNLVGPDNRIRVSLQPLPAHEAVGYYTAGQSPLRLSAYYKVSVALLEAEPPPGRVAPVLAYGIGAFPGGWPRLVSTESRQAFRLPGETTTRSQVRRPAEAAPGDEIAFYGSDLSTDRVELTIRRHDWEKPLPVDSSWGVVAGPGRLHATVQERVGATRVLPGLYSAQVVLTRSMRSSDGRDRLVEQRSNETPFLVVPRIDTVGTPDLDSQLAIEGAFFEPATETEVAIAQQTLRRVEPTDSLTSGTFRVEGARTLRLCLPDETRDGRAHWVRIRVAGAEAVPRWLSET